MARTPSQNVIFTDNSADGLDDHPVGLQLTDRIVSKLRERGFQSTAPENWRDTGWSTKVTIGEATLKIVHVPMASPQLRLMQIACVSEPGFLAQCLGKRFTDRTSEVASLAFVVDEILRSLNMSQIRWRIDGLPTVDHSTERPIVSLE